MEDHQRTVGANPVESIKILYVAKRRFDPSAGERWERYVAWSGLTQLRELVSLDTMLCPTVPQDLIAADWEHNVHGDYQINYFRSLEYLRRRVAAEADLQILAIVQQPTAIDIENGPTGFSLVGFDVLDVHGDVSALTNCGGFDDVFAKAELSPLGLVSELDRAYEIQRDLRTRYPYEPHAECDVWAIWRPNH